MEKAVIILILISFIFTDAEAREITHEEWQALKKAEQFYKENNMADIIKILTPLAEQPEPHEAIFSYLSTAFIRQGNNTEAYLLLERATKIYPDDYVLDFNFAITAMHLEKYQVAISAFDATRKIKEKKGEDTSQIIYYMATIYYILEQYENAINLIIPLILDKTDTHKQWFQLAVNCYIMKRSWKNAERILEKWIKNIPTEDRAWQMYGDVLLQQKKYKKASGSYEIAILLGNKNISPENLFSIYRYLYVHSEAARWAEHPNMGKTYWLEHAKELYRAAHFEKALQILDKEPEAYKSQEAIILRGKSLLAIGKKDEAVAAWLSCTDLPLPKDKEPRLARQFRDETAASALILAGETCWLHKEWLLARDIFKKLSYIPGHEGTGNALASTMQYLLDNRP